MPEAEDFNEGVSNVTMSQQAEASSRKEQSGIYAQSQSSKDNTMERLTKSQIHPIYQQVEQDQAN